MTEFNLAQKFCENSVRFPDALALSVDAQQFTYRELRNLVQPVSAVCRHVLAAKLLAS